MVRQDLCENDFLEKVKDFDAIINLVGAPIIKRWSKSYKIEIYNSRILTTRKLVNAVTMMPIKPGIFLSVSATGIYPDGGSFTEKDIGYSNEFLGKICQDWENEVKCLDSLCRCVIYRLGVVLDAKSGALTHMLPFFRAGLGGKIGSGNQPFSWIHIDDLVTAFIFALENCEIRGIYNLTSPKPVTNKVYTKALAKVLKRPAVFCIPVFALKLIFGEAASVLTAGQEVLPMRLQEAGFHFQYPSIENALEQLFQLS